MHYTDFPSQMTCVRWYGVRNVRLETAPTPNPRTGDVLLRVGVVGVCGSDIHYYCEGRIGDQVLTPPLILGHEFAGTVVAAADEHYQYLVGCRVAVEPGRACGRCELCLSGKYNLCSRMQFPGGPGCDGALAEYISVPARHCYLLPENVTVEEGALVEPLAVAVYAAELAGDLRGTRVAVFGLGPIGLLTAFCAKYYGASYIVGVDPLAYRAQAASQFGVDHALTTPPSSSENSSEGKKIFLQDAKGYDVVFDCTNSSEGIRLACRYAAPGGTVVLVGISGHNEDAVPVSLARRKGLVLKWCRRFRYTFPRALEILTRHRATAAALLTHRFTLHETQKAFEQVSSYADGILKASIFVDLPK